MRPIIFARIADMKYYKGITSTDMPENGGAYVRDTGEAHECYNFATAINEEGKETCLGFSMLMGHIKTENHSCISKKLLVVNCLRKKSL